MKSKGVAVGIGLLLTVTAAETALQLGDSAIPVASDWPSAESELKSDQVAALPHTIEIVFLGTSITEAAVDPGHLVDLGVVDSAYNAALPFSTPASNEVWLQDVVLATVDPDIVVIGLPIWPANDDQVTVLELGIQIAANNRESPLLEWSALWRHRGVLGSLDRLITRKQWMESGLIDELGHQTGYYDAAGRTLADYFGPFGRPEMSSRQEAALRSMVDMSRAEGAEVVILLEPGRYPRPVPQSTIRQYIEWTRALATELDVPFWDTYTHAWDPGLYVDESHFNRFGTQLYSEYLATLIRAQLTAVDSTTASRWDSGLGSLTGSSEG